MSNQSLEEKLKQVDALKAAFAEAAKGQTDEICTCALLWALVEVVAAFPHLAQPIGREMLGHGARMLFGVPVEMGVGIVADDRGQSDAPARTH